MKKINNVFYAIFFLSACLYAAATFFKLHDTLMTVVFGILSLDRLVVVAKLLIPESHE